MDSFAFNMLRDKKFFKSFWYFVKLFGLQPFKLNVFEKARAIAIFLLLYVVCFVLLIIEMITTESVDIKIKGIQTLPTYLIMLFDSLNFVRKSPQIEELFESLCQVIEKSGEQKMFDKCYNKTLRVVRLLAIFTTVSIVMNVIVFYITSYSGIPIYTFSDRGPIFLIIWFIQSVFIHYSSLIAWLLDGFIFFSFSILNGYSIYVGQIIREISFDNKDDFVKRFEEHLHFKR